MVDCSSSDAASATLDDPLSREKSMTFFIVALTTIDYKVHPEELFLAIECNFHANFTLPREQAKSMLR